MQINPVEEWQRLTSLYGEMGDVEIRELAAQMGDLTETAPQVLRDEMKKRGISTTPSSASARTAGDGRSNFSELPDEDDGPPDYTWKVPLCECDSSTEAEQVA